MQTLLRCAARSKRVHYQPRCGRVGRLQAAVSFRACMLCTTSLGAQEVKTSIPPEPETVLNSDNPQSFDDPKKAVLRAALNHVHELG